MFEGNGRYNIYLNTKGKKDDISFDLKEMFKYINGGTDTIGMKTKSKLVKTIDKYVQEFNSNYTWRQGAMTIDMLIRENYDQGKVEGLKEGKAQTQIQIVKNMHSMDLPLEKITKCTGLSTDEVNKILSEK